MDDHKSLDDCKVIAEQPQIRTACAHLDMQIGNTFLSARGSAKVTSVYKVEKLQEKLAPDKIITATTRLIVEMDCEEVHLFGGSFRKRRI